jgi:hypothetical protein
MTVSRPVKILVLILVLAGVGGIASLSMMGKSTTGDEASVVPVRRTTTPRTTTPAATTPRTATTAKPRAVAAKPKATPKPTPKPAVAANGLPTVLNDAFRQHRIVVVSIFDPQAKTDAFSYSEARAGAGDASVGFLGVSVLDDSLAGPLTATLPGGGLLPVPGLLVYRAPGELVQRIDGFADRDAVAQLATSARTAEPLTAAAAPTTTTP